jgi:hypothetical protein
MSQDLLDILLSARTSAARCRAHPVTQNAADACIASINAAVSFVESTMPPKPQRTLDLGVGSDFDISSDAGNEPE